jgi:hypothetical protein
MKVIQETRRAHIKCDIDLRFYYTTLMTNGNKLHVQAKKKTAIQNGGFLFNG